MVHAGGGIKEKFLVWEIRSENMQNKEVGDAPLSKCETSEPPEVSRSRSSRASSQRVTDAVIGFYGVGMEYTRHIICNLSVYKANCLTERQQASVQSEQHCIIPLGEFDACLTCACLCHKSPWLAD